MNAAQTLETNKRIADLGQKVAALVEQLKDLSESLAYEHKLRVAAEDKVDRLQEGLDCRNEHYAQSQHEVARQIELGKGYADERDAYKKELADLRAECASLSSRLSQACKDHLARIHECNAAEAAQKDAEERLELLGRLCSRDVLVQYEAALVEYRKGKTDE